MIEQSMVHLPELLKDIARPVSIYLVYLSRIQSKDFRVRSEACRISANAAGVTKGVTGWQPGG
jgi:hypothetical protein